MRIPDWLPDIHHPKRPGGEPPSAPIRILIQPVMRFMHIEAASGVLLLLCTVIALFLANSQWADQFVAFWQTPVVFSVGDFKLDKTLLLCINDGLMTIFFFVVGLEIKREFVFGELREFRKATLPAAAALGGMVAPALVYLIFQLGSPGERGWGIPMATDIAFVVGFLAILGKRVPFGMKILLLTLAIVDDLGAVLVIAAAYTDDISTTALAVAAAGFVVTTLLNALGVRAISVYVLVGAVIWVAVLKSGVHPTVAGVLLGLLTPASAWFSRESLLRAAEGVIVQLKQDNDNEEEHHEDAVQLLSNTAVETVSPLDRLETALHPWVGFFIMPLFALANAGVSVDMAGLQSPIALAVALGLIIGKPLGIFSFSWLAVKIGVARLPDGVNWKGFLGAACLGGIGFTMSLFIAGLAFKGDADMLSAGKIGTLIGSGVSAVLGCALLLWFLPKPASASKK